MAQSSKSSIVVSNDSTSCAWLMVEINLRPMAFERILSGLGASSLSAFNDLSIALATEAFS